MASQYPPKRILQLLKICSWKNESTLDYTGFGMLADDIISNNSKLHHRDFPDLTQKYLSELLNDAKKKLDKDEKIGRKSDYIEAISCYAGFKNWKEFDESSRLIEQFIDPTKISSSDFEENKVLIEVSTSHKSLIERELIFPEKYFSFPIIYESSKNSTVEEKLVHLTEQCKKIPFVIWTITDDDNEKLAALRESGQLQKLIESGQLIPIRIGETLEQTHLNFKASNYQSAISGSVGLLLALVVIDTLSISPKPSDKKMAVSGPSTNVNTINNSGTVQVIGDIKGTNVALGDFIQNQTINKKED
jgi:hypothetical protein